MRTQCFELDSRVAVLIDSHFKNLCYWMESCLSKCGRKKGRGGGGEVHKENLSWDH
jgi:hypothetical protein